MASSISDQLKAQFEDVSVNAHRAHRLMAYQEHEGDKEKLSQCLEIISKIGVSLTGEVGEWTPLQVAIAAGYELGVECLLAKGVTPSARAIELAGSHHPEFLPLLQPAQPSTSKDPSEPEKIAPRTLASHRAELLEQLFLGSIEMPEGPYVYQSQNDFGVRIDQLLFSRDVTQKEIDDLARMGQPMDVRTTHLTRNMQELAALLGFELVQTLHFNYPRDHMIPQPDVGYLGGASGLAVDNGGASSEQVQESIERAASWMLHMKMGASSFTNHMNFSGITGSTLKSVDRAAKDYFNLFGQERPEGRLHLDGGNIYTVTVGAQRKVLLGISHLGINHHLCHRAGFIQENEEHIKASGGSITYPSGFSKKEVRAYLEEKYALGRVKIDGKIGTLSRQQLGLLHHRYVRGDVKGAYEFALQSGDITPIPKGLPVKEANIQRFAYEREIAQQLTAMTLGVDQSDVHYIPEMGYHLDTFMRPGPKGTMLLQDYGLAAQFLGGLLEAPEAFDLTENDLEILQRYIRTAEALAEDLRPLSDQVNETLQQAGIPVIPVPALFFDESRELEGLPTHHVNFINGVSGYSSKTKRFYYITTGAQVGDNLGEALMDLFAWYIGKTEPKLDVFYVGRTPEDSSDFSEAMRYWNRPGDLASHSGLHCMTMETKFAPVKRK